MNDQCARSEVLAGAIALGEATAAQRDDYRRHISSCTRCLDALGGERQIERVMARVVQARESEVWEPVAVRWNARTRRVAPWHAGVLVVGIALVASFGIHTALALAIRPAPAVRVAVENVPVAKFHVTLEHRAKAAPVPAPRAVAPRVVVARTMPSRPAVETKRMLVVHSVIARRGKDVTQMTTTTTEVAVAPIPQITAPPSNVPIWRRDQALPRPPNLASAPVLTGHAESMAVAPITVIRDVEPLGGDAAISPHPAPIAYAQGAFGTTAFEVQVDDHGLPTHCSITKSSGFASLDVSVCRAAMHVRYMPRTINGKPTDGIYRDAFTFRQLDNNDAQF
ncbi:MAG TPA: TonB family protein [Candidatus Aquilonibacter sp.]